MASIWDDAAYKPYQEQMSARAAEVKKFQDWYTGDAYRVATVRQTAEFEATVKALFHPLTRAADLHAYFLPGFPAYSFTRDQVDKDGAVTVPGTSAEVQQQIQRILKWSRWSEYGPLHNMNFVVKGRSILSITDRGFDETHPIVIEVRDPANTLVIYPDRWSKLPSLMLTVVNDFKVPDRDEPGEFAQIYTPEEVITLFEGVPYSYTDPTTGLDIYTGNMPNELNAVTAVEMRFRDVGNGITQNVFSSVVPIIATVNRMATYIMGVMGSYFKPQLFVAGADRAEEDIEWGEGIMYAPADATANMLLAQLDIKGATDFVASVHKEVKANLPELIFDEIRGINRISTEGLELQFAELISKLTVTRASADRGLADTFRMALWAASEAGAEGFTFNTPPDDPTWEDEPIELDPLRGYVPLGESALLAIEKQRIDRDMALLKLKQMQEEGELRLQGMQDAINNAGSSPPLVNSSASNKTDKPNPQKSGPDATSPGPKQTGNDGQPVER